MDELVQRLSTGEHPIAIVLRPASNLEALRACLDGGYVHVKFTSTRGGTELTVRLDKNASDLEAANDDAATGKIRIAGDLTLNYVKVRCVAEAGLATFEGRGRLEPVQDAADATAANLVA